MPVDSPDDDPLFKVVLNDQEQYSVWPTQRPNPLGWRDAGKSGTKADCLAFIAQIWDDMRPLSVRKQNDAAQE